MTIDQLNQEIAREEAVTEYLRETHAHYIAGMLSLEEALMRLKVVEEMEESWKEKKCPHDNLILDEWGRALGCGDCYFEKEGNSPFDSVSDAEADYS